MVGVIREVQEAATNISYKIDDMTGDLVSVRKWIDAEVCLSSYCSELLKTFCIKMIYFFTCHLGRHKYENKH